MLHGILNCYKPRGKTSRDVVDAVQRRVRPAKAGHAGTLDPLAEGVLVVAIGTASRLIPYLHLYPKTYAATFRLGCESASGDLEQPVTEYPECPRPSLEQLRDAAAALTGNIEQVPPIYSAVKVGGRRAYQAARAAETIGLRPRRVEVQRFEIRRYDYPEVDAEIECGTGTYIRTLGIDLAARVGSRAVMTALVRRSIGPFASDRALALDAIREGVELEDHLLPLAMGVGMLRKVELTDEEVGEIVHGRLIRTGWTLEEPSPMGQWAAVDPMGRLRAILVQRRGAWGPKRVFAIDALAEN